MEFGKGQFTWMENGLGSLCSSDSDSVLFPNIIHFEPDINDHKSCTYLIVLFAVSKFWGLIVFGLRD